ncbi:MAG: cobalamin-dependent protein, partial [Elusimicrobia bacterium]|nr:cobalamin-dependent protein [Elusimicrobiota bacterium]
MPDSRLDVLLVDDEDYYVSIFHGRPLLAGLDFLFLKLMNLARDLLGEPPRAALPLLSAYAKAAGLSVEALPNLSRGPLKGARFSALLRRRPLVVGVSTSAMREARTLAAITARVRRESPDSIVALGGYGAERSAAMRKLGDVCVSGYGELALVRLASALKRDPRLDSVPGIVRDEDGVRTLPGRRHYDPGEKMLRPDWGATSPRSWRYPVEASRGCRFNCSYSTLPGSTRQPHRRPADVVEELAENARKYG